MLGPGRRRRPASSGPPTTTTRQPSSRNRPTRSRQCRVGQRLAACPRPGGRPASGAASPNRPACSRRASSRSGRLADATAASRRPRPGGDRATAAAAAAARPLGRPGQASRSRRATRDPVARRSRRRATRARAVVGQAQAVEQGQPRADLVPARDPRGHVGQQEPAAAHRPADPPGDAARARTSTVRTSPRTSIPRSYRSRPQRPAEPPDRRAQRPTRRPALEPVPLGHVDAVDVRVGLEDLAVARRGQHVDRRAGIGRPEPGKIGLVRTASPMWSSWTTRIFRGAADDGARAGAAARSPSATDPTASRAWTSTRHRSLL